MHDRAWFVRVFFIVMIGVVVLVFTLLKPYDLYKRNNNASIIDIASTSNSSTLKDISTTNDSRRVNWISTAIDTVVGDLALSYPGNWKLELLDKSHYFLRLTSDDFIFENDSATYQQGQELLFLISSQYSNFNELSYEQKTEINIEDVVTKYLNGANTRISKNNDWIISDGQIPMGVTIGNIQSYHSGYTNIYITADCINGTNEAMEEVEKCEQIIDTVEFNFNK